MFKIPYAQISEFEKIFQNHRLSVSATNIYFQHIRFLNLKWQLIDRETYLKFYRPLLDDIELVTSPMESFADNDDENSDEVMHIDRTVPEYEKIKARVLGENIFEVLPPEHPAFFALNEKYDVAIDIVIDDIYIHWCIFKYIKMIDMIRIAKIYTNMTPIIEYVVNNVTLNDFKNHLHSKRINDEKVKAHCGDILFGPDQSRVQNFYADEDGKRNHDIVPAIDVENLIKRIVSNIDVKSDNFIAIGVYMILSFAVTDISKEMYDSPCVKYIIDVLSKV